MGGKKDVPYRSLYITKSVPYMNKGPGLVPNQRESSTESRPTHRAYLKKDTP